MGQKKLFALFVGINGYTECTPLAGCINDVLAMREFFSVFCKDQGLEPHFSFLLKPADDPSELKKLQDLNLDFGTPTRCNMVGAIRALFEHADPAAGDCCLFYYSGHGSTMRAPDEFSEYEPYGQFQTILCSDSRDPGQRDLVDKELGYLFAEGLQGKAFDPDNAELPGVHFVSIMDCCYSGNNTRSKQRKAILRMTPGTTRVQSASELEGFNAPDNPFYAPLVNGKVDRYHGLNHARYVSFSASRDHQPACEMEFSAPLTADDIPPSPTQYGVFTWSLLRALYRSGGKLSYAKMMDQVQEEVRKEVNGQVPKLWTLPQTLDENFSLLSNKIAEPTDGSFLLTCENSASGSTWYVNAGALHGIIPPTDQQKTTFRLNDGSNRVVAVLKVEHSRSILEDTLFTEGDKNKLITANIHQLAFERIPIGFDASVSAAKRAEVVTAFGKIKIPYIKLLDAGQPNARFLISCVLDKKGNPFFIVTTPESNIPLFNIASDVYSSNAHSFVADLNKMGKWFYTLNIANPALDPVVERKLRDQFNIEIQVIEGEVLSQNQIALDWPRKEENPKSLALRYINGLPPKIKVKITNEKLERNYWVGTLLLDVQFTIQSDLTEVTEIGNDAEARSIEMKRNGSPVLEFDLHPCFHEHGVTEITNYLLVFVSTEDHFNLSYFQQEGILFSNQKRAQKPLPGSKADENQWFVIKIPIRIQRPLAPVQFGNTNRTTRFSRVPDEAKSSLPSRFALELFPHPTFTAKVWALSRSQLESAAAALANNSSSDHATLHLLPPPNLWAHTLTEDNAFCFGVAGDPASYLCALEFVNPTGAFSATAPLTIIPGDPLQGIPRPAIAPDLDLLDVAQEVVLPYIFHPLEEAARLYLPAGFTNAKGEIQLTQLPPKSLYHIGAYPEEKMNPSEESMKVFFQKLIWSRRASRYEYNTLTLYRRNGETVLYRCNAPHSAKSKEEIGATLGAAQKVLLLIPGSFEDTRNMCATVFKHPELSSHFDAVLTFDYENLDTEIQTTARNLKTMLADCGLGPAKKLSIVAHSIGGLVSRWWIEKEGGADYVHKLIQLGTPNGGVDLAVFRQKIMALLALGINVVPRFKPYLAPLSYLYGGLGETVFPTLNQLKPDSPLLHDLNRSQDSAVPYFLLAGVANPLDDLFAHDDPRWRKIWSFFQERHPFALTDTTNFDQTPNDLALSLDSMLALPWGHTEVLKPLCDHLSYFEQSQSLEMLQTLIVL